MVSFAASKLLSLIRSRLFIFGFIFIILRNGSTKILLQFMSESVLLMLSSKNFIMSSLTFKTLIHFEKSLSLDSSCVSYFFVVTALVWKAAPAPFLWGNTMVQLQKVCLWLLPAGHPFATLTFANHCVKDTVWSPPVLKCITNNLLIHKH